MKNKNQVTIYDVAKKAKVSIGTVSTAFNKPDKVKDATYKRILKAADELGYKPNVYAKGLAGGNTPSVALLVSDIRYPAMSGVTNGIINELYEAGYVATISITGGNTETALKLVDHLKRLRPSGFIYIPLFFGISADLHAKLNTLRDDKIPVTLVTNGSGYTHLDTVGFNAQLATRELTNYLLGLGHRDIAYLGPQHSSGDSVVRFLGYQESFIRKNLPVRQDLIIETNMTPEGAKAGMSKLMSLEKKPTGIVATNDVVATAIVDYCREHHIQIPDDLSLVSFDNQAIVQRQWPGITSMVYPLDEVGRKAAQMIVSRMQNPDQPVQQFNFDCSLDIRQTTAPPAGRKI